jgi:hypothetical protein
VIVGVAVERADLDGGALHIKPKVAFLTRRQDAVDDAAKRATLEAHHRHRDVFDLNVAVERADLGLHLAPVPVQPEEQVGEMDAERGGRPADFGLPAAAPRDTVIIGVAIPQGITDADQRTAKLPAGDQALNVLGGGTETPLKNTAGVAAGAFFGGHNLVEFGQMPPSIVNFLWLIPETPLTESDLTAAAALLREKANQSGGSDFLKQYARLSGIVLRAPDVLTLWLNPLARHKPPPDLAATLRRLA